MTFAAKAAKAAGYRCYGFLAQRHSSCRILSRRGRAGQGGRALFEQVLTGHRHRRRLYFHSDWAGWVPGSDLHLATTVATVSLHRPDRDKPDASPEHGYRQHEGNEPHLYHLLDFIQSTAIVSLCPTAAARRLSTRNARTNLRVTSQRASRRPLRVGSFQTQPASGCRSSWASVWRTWTRCSRPSRWTRGRRSSPRSTRWSRSTRAAITWRRRSRGRSNASCSWRRRRAEDLQLNGFLVAGGPGFEPGLSDPKSDGLPLADPPAGHRHPNALGPARQAAPAA